MSKKVEKPKLPDEVLKALSELGYSKLESSRMSLQAAQEKIDNQESKWPTRVIVWGVPTNVKVPLDSDTKSRIRQRMAETGETWTQSRKVILNGKKDLLLFSLEDKEKFDTVLREVVQLKIELVQNELERRKEIRKLTTSEDLEEELSALKAKKKELEEEIKDHNQKNGAKGKSKRNPDAIVKGIKAQIDVVSADIKLKNAERKTERERLSKNVKISKKIKEVNHLYGEKGKEIYRDTKNLSSMNKDFAKRCLEQAKEADSKKRGFKGPPRIPRHTGEGGIEVRFNQKSYRKYQPVDQLFNPKNHLCYVEPPHPDAWNFAKDENGEYVVPRARRKQLQRTRARIYVHPKKDPIYFPVIAHRPLPAGEITKVCLHRKRVGDELRTELQISVKLDPTKNLPPERTSNIACGLDIGWRQTKNGLRVAYLVGEDGTKEEICLPSNTKRRRICSSCGFVPKKSMEGMKQCPSCKVEMKVHVSSMLESFAHVEEIRKIRDIKFNEAKEQVAAFLKMAKAKGLEIPEILLPRLNNLSKTNRQKKLFLLLVDWRQNRFDGDEAIFECLTGDETSKTDLIKAREAWYRKDRHLYQFERNRHAALRGQRTDFFRVIADRITRKYSSLYMGKLDLEGAARRALPGETDKFLKKQRKQRVIACLSEFEKFIKEAANKNGCNLVRVPLVNMSSTCPIHGSALEGEAGTLRRMCVSCGQKWDQDQVAATNLLNHGLIASGSTIFEAAE